jgi:photosystem II stability/assembly factor-like uncharacterized protein
MKKIFSLIVFCVAVVCSHAQTVQVLVKDKKVSLRGLSVVSDKVVWVSGTNGTVGKSIDGGDTWNWMTVKGYEKTDFRDIEAFDEKTAVIMGIAEPAYILKTTDGGISWNVVFKDNTKGMFLDAMVFFNEQSGMVIGDPVDNRMFIGWTFDGGNNWRGIPYQNHPVVDSGEACFASSGTNIAVLNPGEAVFVTGGLHSRMYIRDKKYEMPILQGKESTGANSVAVKPGKKSNIIIVVGGDFNTKDATEKNCCITRTGGKTFSVPATPPHGYRSCVEYINNDNWICCGLNGVDYSKDNGSTWEWISKDSFHVCKKAKNGTAVFFAGNGGVSKLVQ